MHLLNTKNPEPKTFFTLNNEARVKRSIKTHLFTRSLSITHPSSLAIPLPQLHSLTYYTAPSFRLSDLLDPPVSTLVATGQMYGTSTHTRMDTGDCFAVYDGTLVMSLTKVTYQRAGLEGVKSSKSPGKWNVKVALSRFAEARTGSSTGPGGGTSTGTSTSTSKALLRVRESFATSALSMALEWTFTLAPARASSSPPVPVPDGFKERSVDCTTTSSTRDVPTSFHALSRVPERGTEAFEIFTEVQSDVENHMALLCLPDSIGGAIDPYISTYSAPQPSVSQDITTTTVTGLIHPLQVMELVDAIRQCSNTLSSSSSSSSSPSGWWCLQARGCEHVPVAWADFEHGYLLGGENCITLLEYPRQPPPVLFHRASKGRDLECDASERDTVMWEVVGSRDAYN